jgi:hypothetical protein
MEKKAMVLLTLGLFDSKNSLFCASRMDVTEKFFSWGFW